MINLLVVISYFFALNSYGKNYSLEDLYNYALENHPNGQILESRVRELQYGVKKIKSSYYPELKAVVGTEKRQGASDDPINTDRGIAELRLKYNLFKFNQTSDQVKGLEQIKAKHELALKKWQASLLREIKLHFYTVSSLKEKLSLIRSELKETDRLKGRILKRKNSGLIGDTDILDLEIRKDSLLIQQNDYEEELEHSLDKLRKTTSIDHRAEIRFKDQFSFKQYKLNLTDLQKKTTNNNQRIQKALLESSFQEKKLKQEKKKKLPELNLMGRYGRMRIDERYSTNSTEGLVGLYLEIPLFDGGSKKNSQNIYQEKYQQKLLEVELLKGNELIDLNHKYELLNRTYRKITILEKSRKQTSLYSKKIQDEYNRGIRNSLDLISSRDRLINLSKDLIESKKFYLVTALEIEKLIGEQLKEEP